MPPPAAPAPSPNSYTTASPAASSAPPGRRLLDPRNDFVFKTLFVHSPSLLVDLIKERGWHQVLVFTRTKWGANGLAEKLL